MILKASEAGIKTVAEGIESKFELDFLKDANCGYGQGFYFSGAVSTTNATLLLSENN